MKMAEFSRRSGVPVATIKYYIREGLLAHGTRTAANQADYDADHLARLDLIRALREVAGLSIATIRETLDAIDHPPAAGDVPDHVSVALRALSAPPDDHDADDPAYHRAAQLVDRVLGELGWNAPPDAAGRADLVAALVAIERQFPGDTSDDTLRRYAEVAHRLAAFEIPETWDPTATPADSLRYAVLGTVLFEPVILALRRLAHVDRHRRLRDARRTADRPPDA